MDEWARGRVLVTALTREEGTVAMDKNDNQNQGDGFSMVYWCGEKLSGEKVSISLEYTLGLWTD
jgi:hypothetical protein